ncbi:Hypothetical predicted protein, partial [Paramuricea clavata]
KMANHMYDLIHCYHGNARENRRKHLKHGHDNIPEIFMETLIIEKRLKLQLHVF